MNKTERMDSENVSILEANEFKNLWVNNNIIKSRNILIESVSPNLFGRYEERLGLLLALIGGTTLTGVTKVRGKIHVLYVGDPGTGKSQLLNYVLKVAPRCVMTTGMTSTGAGLTVNWARENKEFVLEAGALVLADTGVWCIDEFAKMKNDDKGSIHEAMEQQTISVAKGGMVCKVNTRTTIIAAWNQIQSKRHVEDLSVSTGIISSLLSRFDLIFLIPDLHDKDEDIAKADFWLLRSSVSF